MVTPLQLICILCALIRQSIPAHSMQSSLLSGPRSGLPGTKIRRVASRESLDSKAHSPTLSMRSDYQRQTPTYWQNKTMQCPSASEYDFKLHFPADVRSHNLEYKDALDVFWTSLLCKRWQLSWDVLVDYIHHSPSQQWDSTEEWSGKFGHCINIQTTLDSQLFVMYQRSAVSPKLRRSIQQIKTFFLMMNLPEHTSLSALDVIIILGLEPALRLFVPAYYATAMTHPIKWYRWYNQLLSPFYYITYSTQSVEERWHAAWEIFDYATLSNYTDAYTPRELFVGDVFFLSIVRERMLNGCPRRVLERLQSLMGATLEQFLIPTFMCTDFWWQGIQLCGDAYTKKYETTLCPLNEHGEYKPGPQSLQHSMLTLMNLTQTKVKKPPAMKSSEWEEGKKFHSQMTPTILCMEPPLNQTEDEYYTDLYPLTESRNVAGTGLIVLFGGERKSRSGVVTKLSPLMSIPPDISLFVQTAMPHVLLRYEVVIRGVPDEHDWQRPPPAKYRYMSRIGATRVVLEPAVSFVPGNVHFVPGRESPITSEFSKLSAGSARGSARTPDVNQRLLHSPAANMYLRSSPEMRTPARVAGHSPQMDHIMEFLLREPLSPRSRELEWKPKGNLTYNTTRLETPCNKTPKPLGPISFQAIQQSNKRSKANQE
eukprot:97080_1